MRHRSCTHRRFVFDHRTHRSSTSKRTSAHERRERRHEDATRATASRRQWTCGSCVEAKDGRCRQTCVSLRWTFDRNATSATGRADTPCGARTCKRTFRWEFGRIFVSRGTAFGMYTWLSFARVHVLPFVARYLAPSLALLVQRPFHPHVSSILASVDAVPLSLASSAARASPHSS